MRLLTIAAILFVGQQGQAPPPKATIQGTEERRLQTYSCRNHHGPHIESRWRADDGNDSAAASGCL